jgi:hypothetical protein
MTAATARQAQAAPDVDLNVVDAMNHPRLFQPWFYGPSWDNWRAVLKAAYALPMTAGERAFLREVADRDPPARPVRELWCIVGRGGGKDSIASLIAAYAGALFQRRGKLRPGERALVMCLACDRDQAKVVLDFTRTYFQDIEPLKRMVRRSTATGFELDNGVDIAVHTNSFRAVRGRTLLLCVMDECAFWMDERSARPDEETYRAVLPGLARMPGSLLVGISTPHAKRGLLYKRFNEHYGQDGDVLVVRAPSITFNPTLDGGVIDRAIVDDPEARAEWLAEFRDDVSQWATRELIEAATDHNILARPARVGIKYTAFVDVSGGRSDSFALAIAHMEGNVVTLDCVTEIPAPFSADAAVDHAVSVMREYHCYTVYGDAFGAEWVAQTFQRRAGIQYKPPGYNATEIYINFLPLLTSARVRLVDHQRTRSQLIALERTVLPGGREKIDHPRGAHDDCANAAAGACVLAAAGARFNLGITPAMIARFSVPACPAAWYQPRNAHLIRRW